MLVRELLIALVVLFGFLFGGRYCCKLLQLKQESVSIAGGIVLFLIGVRMIFPPQAAASSATTEGEPFIVPLAIPGVAGPSAMAAVMLLANSQPGRTVDWSVALFARLARDRGDPAVVDLSVPLARAQRADRAGAPDGHAAGRAVGADVP